MICHNRCALPLGTYICDYFCKINSKAGSLYKHFEFLFSLFPDGCIFVCSTANMMWVSQSTFVTVLYRAVGPILVSKFFCNLDFKSYALFVTVRVFLGSIILLKICIKAYIKWVLKKTLYFCSALNKKRSCIVRNYSRNYHFIYQVGI